MTTLALDTSTTATAVALARPGGAIRERRDDPGAGAHPGHATRLLELADELLREASAEWADVTRVAAGVGPGTFTGLRVGVASARALAQSLNAELVAVSSLMALAWPALRGEAPQADAVLSVIDARRGEVFASVYRASAQGPPKQLLEPAAFSPQALTELAVGVLDDGAGGARWLMIGDGALRHADALAVLGAHMPAADSPLHRVSAAAVCELSAGLPAVASIAELLPDYRRAPDAKTSAERAPLVAPA